LAELVKGVERGEVGLVNPHKDSLERDIEQHVQDYITHHLAERERLLRAVLNGCGFKYRVHLEVAEEADEEQRRPPTVRKGPRKGGRYAGVRPEVRQRLLTEGRERRLLYMR
jgi:hypothetical protein